MQNTLYLERRLSFIQRKINIKHKFEKSIQENYFWRFSKGKTHINTILRKKKLGEVKRLEHKKNKNNQFKVFNFLIKY